VNCERMIPHRTLLAVCAVLTVAGYAATPAVAAEDPIRELAVRYIRSALKFPANPVVRSAAIEAAESLGPQDRALIRDGLKDEHPGVRFAACMALGRLGDKAALPAIRERVNDSDDSVRVAAYFALEKMGDASNRVQWADALRHAKEPAVRRNAALAMGKLGDPAVTILLTAALHDEDEGVRIQASEALALLGDKQLIGRFIRDAYGGVGFKQAVALVVLGQVKDERVIPALRARLVESPYLEAKLAAARGLGMHGYTNGYELALRSLNWNEPQPNLADDPAVNQVMRVRTMAATALGEIADPRAIPALRDRMKTPDDPRIQLAAARAILMILDRTAAANPAAPGGKPTDMNKPTTATQP
jgi:HEAT repeat protein